LPELLHGTCVRLSSADLNVIMKPRSISASDLMSLELENVSLAKIHALVKGKSWRCIYAVDPQNHYVSARLVEGVLVQEQVEAKD
jgi:hypothetical protein